MSEANDIRVCVDMFPPDEVRADAEAEALDERVDNLQVVPLPDRGPAVARMAIVVRRRWTPGIQLRARFVDGDASVQQRVINVAKEWMKHANVTLEFGTDPDAEIRISFQQEGSWSAIGTDARLFRRADPTMNYGWLTPSTGDEEYRRVVLHEFGHALGCIHEHQSPGAEIPWNKPVVYEYYQRTQGWTREDVDRNLFGRYEASTTNFSAFDSKSIMLYAIPDEHTIGTWSVGWNRDLSETDKSFIGIQYPGAAPQPVELQVDGARADAEIGQDGEIDVFTFTVAERKRHIITTEGPTNVVMSVHGPDDETVLVAADDDSGKATNARIVRALQPGRYWIRVRHFAPTETGPYTVGVRTRRVT